MSNKNLAIVGFAATTRDLAPYDDPEFDIWGINEMGMIYPNQRFTEWYNIHQNIEILPDNRRWLAARQEPVYILEPCAEIPNAHIFPLEAIKNHRLIAPIAECLKSKDPHGNYFTSSIAMLIAWGITRGYQEIHLYGVDMASDSEYQYQAKCCEFWLGVAMGMGITVHVPTDSHLLKQGWLYGYELPPNTEGIISEPLLNERLRAVQEAQTKAQQQIMDANCALATLQGAAAQIQFLKTHVTTLKRQLGLPPGPS